MKTPSYLILTGAITLLFNLAHARIPAGLWNSRCIEGLSKTQNYTSENQVEVQEKFHQDLFCQKPSFEFRTSGYVTYPTNHDQPNVENLIDFTYSEIEVILFLPLIVDDFNERKVCGRTDWKLETPQKITGLSCALFNLTKPTTIPPAGDMKYGIYKIEYEILHFGQLSKENDSSTPEKRPKNYEFRGYELQKNLLNAL